MGQGRGRVVIVDDEEACRFGMQAVLEDHGWAVECAADSAEASSLLRRGACHAMIVDNRLSREFETEGLSLLRWVRREAPRVRVIVVTGYGSPDTRRAARDLGADAYYEKPVPPSVLLHDLERWWMEELSAPGGERGSLTPGPHHAQSHPEEER